MCIEEAARDLGTLLTLREEGATKIDPRPLYDDDTDTKTPLKTLEPEETELEDIPLVQGTKKTIKIGKTQLPTIKVELAQLMRRTQASLHGLPQTCLALTLPP
ncbi:unnamed protein product [Amaranthus hypochondriacus]